jgi:hypothetical protein
MLRCNTHFADRTRIDGGDDGGFDAPGQAFAPRGRYESSSGGRNLEKRCGGIFLGNQQH